MVKKRFLFCRYGNLVILTPQQQQSREADDRDQADPEDRVRVGFRLLDMLPDKCLHFGREGPRDEGQ